MNFSDWARRLKVLLRPCLYSTGENWTHGKRISHMRGFTERVIGFYFDIAKSTTTNRIQRARLFFGGNDWRLFCITILRKHLTDLVSITVECRVLLYKQLMMAQQTCVCQPIALTGVVCMIIIRCILLAFAYLTNRWKSRNRAWFFTIQPNRGSCAVTARVGFLGMNGRRPDAQHTQWVDNKKNRRKER